MPHIEKKLRNPAFEFRYQVTPIDNDGYSLDSVWCHTKQEAREAAIKILMNDNTLRYVECFNRLNNNLSFKIK